MPPKLTCILRINRAETALSVWTQQMATQIKALGYIVDSCGCLYLCLNHQIRNWHITQPPVPQWSDGWKTTPRLILQTWTCGPCTQQNNATCGCQGRFGCCQEFCFFLIAPFLFDFYNFWSFRSGSCQFLVPAEFRRSYVALCHTLDQPWPAMWYLRGHTVVSL